MIREFIANQGLLLAGAVAYNTLLSMVPALAVTTVLISQWLNPELVLATTRQSLLLVLPEHAELLTRQLADFLAHWKLVGSIGLAMLLLFSLLAFSVLEAAMTRIFSHRRERHGRKAWVSMLLPFAYLLVMGAALVVLTGLHWALHNLPLAQGAVQSIALALGFLGETLLFASIYHVMPHGPVALRHALIGGVAAAFMWELTRRVATWYLTEASLVNAVYGTLAAAVTVLLLLEIGAVILLLGAQIIAEYEQSDIRPGADRPGPADGRASDE